MEIREIYDLWDKFEDSDLCEMEMELNGAKLRLSRVNAASYYQQVGNGVQGMVQNMNAQGTTGNAQSVTETAQSANNNQASSNMAQSTENLLEIKAPLVGTFYRATAPDAKPFVEPGTQVNKGDVVGIVEAMKLMNEIMSPVKGVVTEVIAGNGELVEFEEVLVRIKPDMEG